MINHQEWVQDGADSTAPVSGTFLSPRDSELWKHYGGLEHLHYHVTQALLKDRLQRVSAGEVQRLDGAWAFYEKRNLVLQHLQYDSRFAGKLFVTVVCADSIRPPPSNILMLGHAVKTGSLFNFHPPTVLGLASVGHNLALHHAEMIQQPWTVQSDFRPTTQVRITYQCAVLEGGSEAWSVSSKHKSPWIKKNSSPNFDFATSFDIPDRPFSGHMVKLELMEKHNFGEDVIGMGSCDVSSLVEGFHNETGIKVTLSRQESSQEDDPICSLQVKVYFAYDLDAFDADSFCNRLGPSHSWWL
jgi:hypothetical protein